MLDSLDSTISKSTLVETSKMTRNIEFRTFLVGITCGTRGLGIKTWHHTKCKNLTQVKYVPWSQKIILIPQTHKIHVLSRQNISPQNLTCFKYWHCRSFLLFQCYINKFIQIWNKDWHYRRFIEATIHKTLWKHFIYFHFKHDRTVAVS